MAMLGNLFFPNSSFDYALLRNQAFWGLVNFNNELVPVRGQHGNGKPHRSTRLVERSSEYLITPTRPSWGRLKKTASAASGRRTEIQSRYPTCRRPRVSARYFTVPTSISSAWMSWLAPWSTKAIG